MAYLPGLMEGSSQGVGLGIQFLRHIERTKVILHLVSMDPENGRDALDDYQKIRKELLQYDQNLEQKREIIVATQLDLPGAKVKFADFTSELQKAGITEQVHAISSITHEGVERLMQDTASMVELVEKEQVQAKDNQPVAETKEYRYQAPAKSEFTITKVEDHVFEIQGESIERLVERTNLDYQDGVLRLARKLKNLGIDEALRKKGAVDGDDVIIGTFNFEFMQ